MFDLVLNENRAKNSVSEKPQQQNDQDYFQAVNLLKSGKDCLPFPECGVDFSELEQILGS